MKIIKVEQIMLRSNFILNTDSYKASHFCQYPPNTEYISSYIEARGGEYRLSVFFGLQLFIKKYLLDPISRKDIDEAKEIIIGQGLPFYEEGWNYILQQHNGFLPIEIEAVEEGTVLPIENVLVQVINTDPKCFWLTNYIETALLRAIWYPTTVATRSWTCKETILYYLERTADNVEGIDFKLHDFGARGASSTETSEIGGLAHLANFNGSDNVLAVMAAKKYYGLPNAAFSVPAAEHSTITSWGKENERQAYQHILNQFSGNYSLISIVSDSYDIWNAIDNIWGKELKDQVINNKGTLVIRPDSGEPVRTTTELIEKLISIFGYSVNSKGYRVLPPYLRVIQGGGVSPITIKAMLSSMEFKKQSAENIVFGMGGELLQKLDRDTMRFAMKTSAIKIGDIWHDVYKDPITDNRKRSKKGRLALIKDHNQYKTIPLSQLNNQTNLLQPVFKNGKLLLQTSLSSIRAKIASYYNQ